MTADEARSARQDCRELVAALVHYADHGEAEKAAALFAADGVWVRSGTPYAGRAAIVASFAGRTPGAVRHLNTNVHIELTGPTTAVGVSYYLAYRDRQDGASPLVQPVAMGEWHDTFVRTAEGWRFARRVGKRVFSP